MALAKDSSSGTGFWRIKLRSMYSILFLAALSLCGCCLRIEALDQAILEPLLPRSCLPRHSLPCLTGCIVVFPQQQSRWTVALTLDLSSPIAAARGSKLKT